MYVPAAFREDDPALLHDLMRRFPFALLVTVRDGVPVATPLPFTVDAEGGKLRAHLARANPQWRDLEGGEEVLVVFSGPHAYVSPAWYAASPSVPTWNYATVHAYGRARLLDADATYALLRESVARFDPNPAALDLPEEHVRKTQAGVVGFEIALTRLEGKWKMSQNKTEGDRAGVIAALSGSEDPEAREVSDVMRAQQTVGGEP